MGVLTTLLLLVAAAGADHYRTLGVSRRASQADIKAAYRDAAKKYHVRQCHHPLHARHSQPSSPQPDKNKDDSAQRRFQQIAEAHEVHTAPPPAGPALWPTSIHVAAGAVRP